MSDNDFEGSFETYGRGSNRGRGGGRGRGRGHSSSMSGSDFSGGDSDSSGDRGGNRGRGRGRGGRGSSWERDRQNMLGCAAVPTMGLHPAVLAGAHQRVSALSLLRDAFPFRGHAVPIAVVAAAVAPFMAPAHFDPQTYPERISVLNVQVKTRPADFFQHYTTSYRSHGFLSEQVPSYEADSIAETLSMWRPLKALTLGTGGRITELLPVAPILTLHNDSVFGQVDLTQLRSLIFANCVLTADDIVVLAARATALTSLQLGMANAMSTAGSDLIMAQVFTEQWQGKLTALMLAPNANSWHQWDRTTEAVERAGESRHPCAVTSTLETLRINGLPCLPQFRSLVAACPRLRRLEVLAVRIDSAFVRACNPSVYRSRPNGTPSDVPELLAAACCGSVARSSLEHCNCLFRVSDVAQARRKLKRILRSDSSCAASPPTLEELGLVDACFSSLTVMPC